MKKIFLIITLTFNYFFSVNAQKEQLDQLFDRYQNTEGITSIKIAKPMLSMLSKLGIKDSEINQITPLLNNIQGLKILIVEKPEKATNKPITFYDNLRKEILSSVNKLNYQELMTVNNKGSKTKFLSSEISNGMLDDLLLNINSKGNTILMMVDGKISIEDVNNLINDNQNRTSTVITTTSSSKSTTETLNIEYKSDSTASSEIRKVGKFSGIEASRGVKVNFSQSNTQKITVETDAGMLPYIITEVEGDILKIYIDNKGNRSLRIRKVLVSVEAPHLEKIKTSSGASFNTLNRVKSNNFTISASSGSNINASLNANTTISVEATSGASLKIDENAANLIYKGNSGSSSEITGKSTKAHFALSSAASCNAQDATIQTVEASVSSGASLKVNATKTLVSQTSSGGSVRYSGNPINVNSSNSSGGRTKSLTNF